MSIEWESDSQFHTFKVHMVELVGNFLVFGVSCDVWFAQQVSHPLGLISLACDKAQACYWQWKFSHLLNWSWVCYCCYRLTLLAKLHYGGFHALILATKCQARETGRLVWETKWMMRAELFQREKDQWYTKCYQLPPSLNIKMSWWGSQG